MRIGDSEIMTPAEDGVGYALDWRWQAANALVRLQAAGAKAPAAADADVRKLARHLAVKAANGVEAKSTFARVRGWRGTGTGALVEAYLLACGTAADAAAELCMPPDDTVLYARLFFDIHDCSGAVRVPVLLRIRAETLAQNEPDAAATLRAVAVRGGLAGLRNLLGEASQPQASAGEPTLDQMVDAELKRRLAAGELRTGDLVRLQANAIARERVARETSGGNSDVLEGVRVMQNILSLTAPAMVKPERTPEQAQATDTAIRARFEAQMNIGSTPLQHDDPAKAEAALNALISGTFKANENEPKPNPRQTAGTT